MGVNRTMTVAILGTGESLTEEAAAHARANADFVIAITDAFLRAPWAHALFAYDQAWWDKYPEAREFRGLRWCAEDTEHAATIGGYCEAIPVPLEGGKVGCLSVKSSGLSAIRWAADAGAKRILLYGFDRRPGHFHKRHNNVDRHLPQRATYEAWWIAINHMIKDYAADGIELRREFSIDDGEPPAIFRPEEGAPVRVVESPIAIVGERAA